MRLAPALSALTLVAGTLIGLAAPSSAAPAPVVVSPAPGQTVPYGSAVDLVVDFPQSGSHSISVTCGAGEGAVEGTIFTGSVEAGREVFDISDELVTESETGGSATCTVTFNAGSIFTTPTTSTFAVAAPPALSLGSLQTSKKTFYPLVKDGFLDGFELRYGTNRIVLGDTITVRDAKGRTVLDDPYDQPYIGPAEWTWNGRTKGGKPVLPGKYTLTISATALDGTTETLTTSARVATKVVTRRKKVEIDKGWKGDFSSKGACRATSDRGRDTAVLDCRGGEFAAVTYDFALPEDARKIKFGAETERTADDLYRGAITTRGIRAGRTRFQVRVQVTDQRSVEVSRAWISYVSRFQI